MDAALRTTSILGCQDAVIRFFAALDEGRMDDVAGAMADDGVWHRQGKMLRGPGEVSAALAARPAGRVTAHLVQNVIIDLEDAHTARVRYLVLTYRHDFPDVAAAVAPLSQPYSIAAYDDRMRFDGARWRVLERRSRNIFVTE
jgi:hypothetical protein